MFCLVLLLQNVVANIAFFILVCSFIYGLFIRAPGSSDFIASDDSMISER